MKQPSSKLILLTIVIATGTFSVLLCTFDNPLKSDIAKTMEADKPDCLISVEAKAWSDTNGNGLWEKDEKPLAGVELTIPNHSTGGITDDKGVAQMAFLESCYKTPEIAITEATTPDSMLATTPLQQEYRYDGHMPQFGFKLNISTTSP